MTLAYRNSLVMVPGDSCRLDNYGLCKCVYRFIILARRISVHMGVSLYDYQDNSAPILAGS